MVRKMKTTSAQELMGEPVYNIDYDTVKPASALQMYESLTAMDGLPFDTVLARNDNGTLTVRGVAQIVARLNKLLRLIQRAGKFRGQPQFKDAFNTLLDVDSGDTEDIEERYGQMLARLEAVGHTKSHLVWLAAGKGVMVELMTDPVFQREQLQTASIILAGLDDNPEKGMEQVLSDSLTKGSPATAAKAAKVKKIADEAGKGAYQALRDIVKQSS